MTPAVATRMKKSFVRHDQPVAREADQREEGDDHQRSGKSELLADDGEDEVVVSRGQPLPLLPAGPQPHTPPTAVGEGVLAVGRLPAGAVGVDAAATDPVLDPAHAVGAGDDHGGCQGCGAGAGHQEHPRRDTGGEEQPDDDGQEHQAGAEVLAAEHEQQQQASGGEDQWDGYVHELAELAPFLGQHRGTEQDQRDLGELRGLNLLTGDLDPVAVAVDRDAQARHEDQDLKEDGPRQQRHGHPLPGDQGDPGGDEGADDANDGGLQLGEEDGVGRVGVLVRRHAGGGEHHDQADDDQHRGGAEQQVVGRDRGLKAFPPRHRPASAGRVSRSGRRSSAPG